VFQICISAGHGGEDPGAIGAIGLKEKDVNLAIANFLGEYLIRAGQEVHIVRANDCTVDLKQRIDFANVNKVDVFVDIHCNSFSDNRIHGAEVFYYQGSVRGKLLADTIITHYCKETELANRGKKTGDFAVLRNTKMPAVLVECGFLSNKAEEAFLGNPIFQKKCALGIARGIAEYLNFELKEEKSMFKDVDPKAWYANSINQVVNAGLIGGYSDNTFKPNNTVTRAELASVLSRYLFQDGVFTDIYPKVRQSVVRISHSSGIGSGVCIGGQKILTCKHVVDGAKEYEVDTFLVQGIKGKYLIASSVPGEDLALIEIPIILPAIKIASKAAEGEVVAVVGSPLGVKQTITVGVISAFEQGDVKQYTQIDAPINPGNSGGLCCNEKGELIALAAAKVVSMTVEGVGYGINLEKINAFLKRVL